MGVAHYFLLNWESLEEVIILQPSFLHIESRRSRLVIPFGDLEEDRQRVGCHIRALVSRNGEILRAVWKDRRTPLQCG